MEQRITRAKAAWRRRRGVRNAGRGRAGRATEIVSAMIYLVFNEGYSAAGAQEMPQVFDEAIRLGRLLLRIFPSEPETMGLLALMLLQHSRAPARFDADGQIVLLEDQDRSLWDRNLINEALALLDKAIRIGGRGLIRCRRRSRHCMRAPRGRRYRLGGDRSSLSYAGDDAPFAGRHAQRAVAVSKLNGARRRWRVEPLAGARQLFLFPWPERRTADAGRSQPRGPRAFDRAIALAIPGGSRPYPLAAGPA